MFKPNYSSYTRDSHHVSPSRSRQSSSRLERSPSRSYRSSSRSQGSTSHSHFQSSRSKRPPFHLRDVNNPPPYLDSSQQQSWIKTAEKAKLNHQYQQQYPPFHVPSVMYQVMYINKYTTCDTMNLLIEHAEECSEYSIDTEGDKSTHETALIQIESIPRTLPKYIIILELAHLPSNNSSSKVLIKKFLQCIFRSGNKIYSWGDLAHELSNVTQEDLLCPLEADPYDIQALFSNWYLWARSQCGGCDLSNNKQCHQISPYRWKEKWALQRALIYVNGVFIDKSITVNDWSTLLDPAHSTLSKTTHEQRIRYLINDCLATTYLRKAVVEYWTFDKLTKTNFTDLFTSSLTSSLIINNNNINITIKNSTRITKKIKSNIDGQIFKNALDNDLELISGESDVEQISDEEIHLNQLTKPNIIKQLQDDIINDEEPMEHAQQQHLEQDENDIIMMEGSVNNHQEVVDVQNDQNDIEKPRKHRTAQAKKKKNLKRNTQHRKRRFRYAVRRDVYRYFPMPMIKFILKRYGIKFVHVKIDEENSDLVIIIGLKTRHLRDETEHRLPMTLFNEKNYYYYRRKYYRR